MTSRSQPAALQRGRGWYRWVFLILAVAPLALVMPLVVGSPLPGTAALLTGGVVGVAVISARDHVSRRARKAGTVEQPAADVSPEQQDQEPPPLPPQHYKPRDGYRGAPIAEAKPPVSRYGGGCPDGTCPPVAPVRQSRTEHVPSPPVLEGGTTAGRSPWRLPAGLAQSGIAADAAQLGDLEVRAASVIGPGHRCAEPATARQDAYALMRTRSGSHLIVAVADGVSSSPNSEIGARVAVSTAARTLHRALEASPDLARLEAGTLFTEVAREMVGTGRNRRLDDHTLHSLLIVAVIPSVAQPNGSRRVWTAQVGDVSLWLHGRTGWCRQTGGAKGGLDRNRVDASLPFNPDRVVAGFIDVPLGQGVAVMTDGLGDTLSEVANAGSLFADRWARPPHLSEFVSDLCFDAPGQIDDRTAVVVWCGL